MAHLVNPPAHATAVTWDADLEAGYAELARFAIFCKNGGGPNTPHKEAEWNRRRPAVTALLFYLEHEVQPTTPRNRELADMCVALILDDGRFSQHFNEADKQAAKNARERFIEEDGFEEGSTAESDDDDGAAPGPSAPANAAGSASSPTTGNDGPAVSGASILELPAPNHPIWGIGQIMHGFARKPRSRGALGDVMDPRYSSEKRSAKVIGHNGFVPGAWFPYQKVAHFHGCHGSPVNGICGDRNQGAFSVVLSNSSYAGMDQDNGNQIKYSADHSRDKTAEDNNRDSKATLSLVKSKQTGKPVRVLRNRDRKDRKQTQPRFWAPSVGMRYDGLYRVTDIEDAINRHGGPYKLFKLERMEVGSGPFQNSRSLDDIRRTVPSLAECQMFERIADRY